MKYDYFNSQLDEVQADKNQGWTFLWICYCYKIKSAIKSKH